MAANLIFLVLSVCHKTVEQDRQISKLLSPKYSTLSLRQRRPLPWSVQDSLVTGNLFSFQPIAQLFLQALRIPILTPLDSPGRCAKVKRLCSYCCCLCSMLSLSAVREFLGNELWRTKPRLRNSDCSFSACRAISGLDHLSKLKSFSSVVFLEKTKPVTSVTYAVEKTQFAANLNFI